METIETRNAIIGAGAMGSAAAYHLADGASRSS